MAKTGIGKSTKDDETVNNSTTEYALGSGYSKSGRKLPSNAEEAIAAGRYLDDDGYWRTSSGYRLRTGTSQGGGYTTYDGVGGGNKTPNSNNSDADSAVSKLYNYVNGTGSVSSNQPQYSDRYDLSDIIDRLNNMSYEDWTDSDEYEALAERYNLLGKKAMQNTLGQVSGRTGGLASSYATTVAEQANNDYMSQLEEMARNMYENDRDDLESQYKYMSDYNDTLYNRYRDSLSDALAAEQLAYDREQDEKEWAYKLAQLAQKTSGTTSSSSTTSKKKTSKTGTTADDDEDNSTTLEDMRNLYVQAKTDELTNALNAGLLNQAQARATKNLLKVGSNKSTTGNTTTSGTTSKVKYNSSTDKFTFGGKTYSTIDELQNAVASADLTDSEWNAIIAYLKNQGFTVSEN